MTTVTTALTEKTFTIDGKLVHQQYNLRSLLKSLHERGWIGNRLGTWIADIVACAMVFFSLSGLIMWFVRRIRKVRNFARSRRHNEHALSQDRGGWSLRSVPL